MDIHGRQPREWQEQVAQTTQYEQHLTDDNSLVADVLRIPGPDGLFLDVHGSIEVGVQLGGQNTIPAPVAPSVALTPGISSHSRSATRWSRENVLNTGHSVPSSRVTYSSGVTGTFR